MTHEHISPACLDDDFAVAPSDIDYNPDDYRWVPVQRRPRYDGWTEEKQRRFIEALNYGNYGDRWNYSDVVDGAPLADCLTTTMPWMIRIPESNSNQSAVHNITVTAQ